MLTRRHFQAIADIVARTAPAAHDPSSVSDRRLQDLDRVYRAGAAQQQHTLAHALADWAATQNPRFDRTRFLRACGLEG